MGLSDFGSELLESLQWEQKPQLQRHGLLLAGQREWEEQYEGGEGEGTMGSGWSQGLGATGASVRSTPGLLGQVAGRGSLPLFFLPSALLALGLSTHRPAPFGS